MGAGRRDVPPPRAGDAVYAALREDIVSGRIPPGARLSVPAIAQEYAVSRSPARDAVIRLVQEGLARDVVNRGAVVAVLEPGELVSLYRVREALEWAAARLAAEHATPALRRRLLAILTEHERVVRAGDFARHMALDAAFHRELRLAADNPVLLHLLDGIQDRVLLAMRSTSVSGGMRRALEEHRAIFEAVSAGRGEAAAAAARAHIGRLTQVLRARELSA